MTIVIVPSSTTDQTVTGDDTLFILPQSATIDFANFGAAFAMNGTLNSTFVVRGTVTATTAHGIALDFNSTGSNLRIGATGWVDAVGFAARLWGNENTLVNRGALITRGTNNALELAGSQETATNHGVVRATESAGATGVLLNTNRTDNLLINTGRILADTGVALGSANSEVDNDGRIVGASVGVHALAQGGHNEIHNAGVIVGGDYGIRSDQTGALVIVNEGTIRTQDTAAGAAIYGSAAVDEVANAGEIVGDVHLAGGADTYVGLGAGSVDGAVYAGLGDDTLRGGSAADRLYGDGGLDYLYGGGGRDKLFGGDDMDFLYGEGGADRIKGGTGADVVHGGAGNDRLWGDTDNDVLHGDGGNDIIRGGDDDDTAWGGDGADRIFGDAGYDALHGEEGDDSLDGGAGADTIYGDGGSDLLRGGDDSDALYGGNRADRLEGGADDDTLAGEGGNDALFGGAGKDWLYGDAGKDRLTGGAGADHFAFSPSGPTANFGTDRVLDFEDGVDKIVLSLGIPDMTAFLAAALSNQNGNAVIDLSVANPALYSGTLIVVDAAGQIDTGDFL